MSLLASIQAFACRAHVVQNGPRLTIFGQDLPNLSNCYLVRPRRDWMTF